MRVLVAGGTGRLGALLVEQLTTQGVSVRVLTRDPRRAEPLRRFSVEVVPGDVRAPATLPGAMAGVDVVVSAVQGFAGPGRGTPKTVDEKGNVYLAAAAQEAGAAVVMMSIVGAAADSPMELFRRKYAAEQVLRASGVPWTVVRATSFVELWAEIIGHGIVLGCGENPINFVSVDDVAELVVQAVLDPKLRGRVLEIGGPRDLSFNELARTLREVRGDSSRVRHVPRPVLRGLALLHRQPRAALLMDTIDLTYRPGPHGRTGATEPREALAAASRGRT